MAGRYSIVSWWLVLICPKVSMKNSQTNSVSQRPKGVIKILCRVDLLIYAWDIKHDLRVATVRNGYGHYGPSSTNKISKAGCVCPTIPRTNDFFPLCCGTDSRHGKSCSMSSESNADRGWKNKNVFGVLWVGWSSIRWFRIPIGFDSWPYCIYIYISIYIYIYIIILYIYIYLLYILYILYYIYINKHGKKTKSTSRATAPGRRRASLLPRGRRRGWAWALRGRRLCPLGVEAP